MMCEYFRLQVEKDVRSLSSSMPAMLLQAARCLSGVPSFPLARLKLLTARLMLESMIHDLSIRTKDVSAS
jgi:hypothetical protein